ncbi:AAA family ATPase [Acinetobacter sp. WCHA39]|uniref:AAA family ATPase n=1 Tax=Acinetobacter sp. WCHA39 TaxID=2004648 RepID=UPI000B3C05E6|nr:DUF3696 domain-containing protein [Acinetobacter sp. WCHA39]
MITSLSLENFKSFQKLDKLEIKPLTILLGRNSCGKSSIIQSLLLLKQTLDDDGNADLNVEGKYLKFSNLTEISYGLPKDELANIQYKINVTKLKDSAEFFLEFRNKKEYGSYKPYLSTFIHKSGDKEVNLMELNEDFFSKSLSSLIKDLKDSNESKFKGINKFEIGFQNFIPKVIILESNNKKKKFMFPISFAYENLMVDEFERDIHKIKYLSPLRASPERVYIHYAKNASEITENGANCAHVLWAKKSELIYFDKKRIKLIDAVHKSIEILGLAQKLSSEQINDMVYQIDLKLKNSKKAVSLADVGFGYSQILPVILLGLINNDDNLILIEQPEIHLHPSSAGKLADLFLTFIKDRKRFIIETHSQELINKLRLRVIQNPELKNLINIVFIDQDDEGTQIKQFEIDENGMFPEWPNGFLDESENLAREILLARVGRSDD